MARNAITNSRMRGAGCDHGIEKRRSMCGFTCEPRPRTNRPVEYSARFYPAFAMVIGERAKAIAMDVPIVSRLVTSAAWSNCRNGSCRVSPTHRPSYPASSIAAAALLVAAIAFVSVESTSTARLDAGQDATGNEMGTRFA